MNVHSILRRPILTEKTTGSIERQNAYVFEVAPESNKIQVKVAVEELFDVKVAKVNVRNRKGKRKRVGKSVGFGKDRKEAVVTLKAGHKIDVY
jgi:large subunit ribosomal protein L23